MVIYNVTINVDMNIQEDWLNWMKKEHIPDVLNTGKFQGYRMLRVVNRSAGEEGVTYVVQYFCENLRKLQEYQAHYAQLLQQKHQDKYGTQVMAFRTILEDV